LEKYEEEVKNEGITYSFLKSTKEALTFKEGGNLKTHYPL
jgi:hypothetical protein